MNKVAILLVSLLAGCAEMYPVPPATMGNTASGTSTGTLAVKRVELVFDNDRAQITVPRKGRLAARATLQFNGNGLFRGAWLVDGTTVEEISRSVSHGESLVLTTSPTTILPTFAPGSHALTLKITEPATPLKLPVIHYVVTTDAATGVGP